MDINDYLRNMVEKEASDIILKVGSPPAVRVSGELELIGEEKLMPETLQEMIFGILDATQQSMLLEQGYRELDFAYSLAGVSRFRANIFWQRGSLGLVMRRIPFGVPAFEDLNLPNAIMKLANERRGMILVTGNTGSGKTTTLSSMIDYINANRKVHIITIEDPIEVLHKDKMGIVTQREVGMDTNSFADALKYVLRQNPDVILIGEMRDFETISAAMVAAETGHLVLSTLHTIDAAQTINRIIDVHPPHQQGQARIALAAILKGVISQRLIPRKDGEGMIPAVEIMLTTTRIRDMLLRGRDLADITLAIKEGKEHYGMQTFDQSLIDLYREDFISFEDAQHYATSPTDLRLMKRQIDYELKQKNKI